MFSYLQRYTVSFDAGLWSEWINDLHHGLSMAQKEGYETQPVLAGWIQPWLRFRSVWHSFYNVCDCCGFLPTLRIAMGILVTGTNLKSMWMS